MTGTCPRCRDQQAEGLVDYCCVRCVITQHSLPFTMTQDQETTVITYDPTRDKTHTA